MSNYCILRLAKRRTPGAAAMARHALRAADVSNADPMRQADNQVLAGSSTPEGVMADLRAKLPEKRRKDAVTCLDFFVGTSPEAMQSMTRKQQDQYFRRALGWIGKEFGGRANVVSAVVHRDEATPHMQVLLVPLLDGRLNAKRLVGNRGHMQALQDGFAEVVGAPEGLRRGERSSGASHTSIRQFYGAIEAAGTKDALPPRVPVPRALPEPGMFSSAATRKAFEDREEERRQAMEANAKRQAEIERLARLGLATHGRSRRRLPKVLTEAEHTLEAARASQIVIDQARALLDKLTPDQQRQVIEATRGELAKQAKPDPAPGPTIPTRKRAKSTGPKP